MEAQASQWGEPVCGPSLLPSPEGRGEALTGSSLRALGCFQHPPAASLRLPVGVERPQGSASSRQRWSENQRKKWAEAGTPAVMSSPPLKWLPQPLCTPYPELREVLKRHLRLYPVQAYLKPGEQRTRGRG